MIWSHWHSKIVHWNRYPPSLGKDFQISLEPDPESGWHCR